MKLIRPKGEIGRHTGKGFKVLKDGDLSSISARGIKEGMIDVYLLRGGQFHE